MKRIVWLASYPKSGSTWFRALLENLDRARSEPAEINRLGAPVASSRARFDRVAGVEAADLTLEETDCLRPQAYEYVAESSADGEPQFCKIHDAFFRPGDGQPLIPLDVTRGAIYLVRNPLDVCASYAHHSNWDIASTIRRMADEEHGLADRADRLEIQLRQRLSSWSGHVRSWLDNGRIPVHALRYEDLAARPIVTIAAALSFAGLSRDRAEMERAVEWSQFARLQAQETEQGFREKPAMARAFFRRGRVGGWREELTPEQSARIVRDHAEVMRRLGYLEESTL